MRILAENLVRLVEDTQFAAATSPQAAPALRGLLFEPTADALRVVATDGSMLVWSEAPATWHGRKPRPVVVEARRLRWWLERLSGGWVDLHWSRSGREVATLANGVASVLPIVADSFPDYRQVDQPMPSRFEVRVAPLRRAVQRAAALLEDVRKDPVAITIYPHKLVIEVAAPWDRADRATFEVQSAGGTGGGVWRIGCDVHALNTLLGQFHGGSVCIDYGGPCGGMAVSNLERWRGVLASHRVTW